MKKTISFVLSIAVAVCAIFVSGAVCNHTYEKTQVEATCAERAYILNHCTDCGDTFKEYASVVEYPDEPYFSIEGEREGNVLNVKVIMGNNPGVWATRLTLYYNSNALKLTEKENGDVWGASASVNASEISSDGTAYVRFYDTSSGLFDNINNGVVFTVSFEIVGLVEDWGITFKYNSKDVINSVGGSVSFNVINTVASGYVDHVYDEGEMIAEPTYTSEGEMKYSCLNCSKTKTEVIPRLVLAGDGNIDGVLDARDCFIIKTHLIGALSDSVETGDLDANGDGAVNAKDLLYLAKLFVAN